MLRAGMYARVSTNDQQTLATQNRAMREYAARRLDDSLAASRGELRGRPERSPPETNRSRPPTGDRRCIGLASGSLGPICYGDARALGSWAREVPFQTVHSVRVFSVVRLSATPNMVLESGQCLDNDSKLFLNARRSQFTSLDLDIQARTRHLPFHRFLHHGSQPVFAGRHIQIESGIDSRR